jgi:hypothetical protein
LVWNGSLEKEAGCYKQNTIANFCVIGIKVEVKLKIFFLYLILVTVTLNSQTCRDNFRFGLYDSTISSYSFGSTNSDYLNNNQKNNHTALNIAGQVVVGSALAFAFTIPSLTGTIAAVYGHTPNEAVQYGLLFLIYSSYVFGAAVGVDWIASIDNQNNSLLETFGYSAIGSGASILLLGILSTQYHQIPTSGVLTALLCPILSSVLYTTLISDWPVQKKVSQEYIQPNNIHNYRDLVEESMQIKVNIFQLRF